MNWETLRRIVWHTLFAYVITATAGFVALAVYMARR